MENHKENERKDLDGEEHEMICDVTGSNQEKDATKVETKKKAHRNTHPCPVCKKAVVHLPRHLRKVHKWDADGITTFDLRAKPKDEKSRINRRRVCPHPGCSAVVRKLYNHLRGKHKLNRLDERYKYYLKIATLEELDPIVVDEEEEMVSSSSSSVQQLTPQERSDIAKRITRGSEMVESTEEEHDDDSDNDSNVIPPSIDANIKPPLRFPIRKRKAKLQIPANEDSFDETDSYVDDFQDPEWICVDDGESDDSDDDGEGDDDVDPDVTC
jgi:hypothetical protein